MTQDLTAGWRPETADEWQFYVPPCRPSAFELGICSEVVEQIRGEIEGRVPRVLVLGSTNEFRDWAFQERLDVTVVDGSRGFYEAASGFRRHARSPERYVECDWRDMEFEAEFDLAVGDLVVGNVPPTDLESLLERVSEALSIGGALLTKSFFRGVRPSTPLTLVDAFLDYERERAPRDPFPWLAYDLTMTCADPNTGLLRFSDMFDVIADAVAVGTLSESVLERYRELGWSSATKIEFHVSSIEQWHRAIDQFFTWDTRLSTKLAWEQDFPYYICRRIK